MTKPPAGNYDHTRGTFGSLDHLKPTAKKLKKLPNYFLSAPQGKNQDNRQYYLWQKINEIIVFLNKDKTEEILIEVSRMIEKRTGV